MQDASLEIGTAQYTCDILSKTNPSRKGSPRSLQVIPASVPQISVHPPASCSCARSIAVRPCGFRARSSSAIGVQAVGVVRCSGDQILVSFGVGAGRVLEMNSGAAANGAQRPQRSWVFGVGRTGTRKLPREGAKMAGY